MPNLDFKPPVEQSANRLNQLLYTLARAYLQRGQFAEAYEKLKQLLQLEGENSEFLLDAAIAGIALNDLSDPALALYQKALEFNPGSKALRLNLVDFFLKYQIVTPFAIELCEGFVEAAPANEAQLRKFLKHCYEVSGMVEKALVEERRVIFTSRDTAAIRAYMEKFWWEGNFAEAHAILQSAPRVNGTVVYLNRELAITHAYENLARPGLPWDARAVESVFSTFTNLTPASAFLDWRDYLLLRATLRPEAVQQWWQNAKRDDLPFDRDHAMLKNVVAFEAGAEPVLRPFEIAREVLSLAAPEAQEIAPAEQETQKWRGYLLAQIISPNRHPIPPRLLNLLSSHLQQLPHTEVRLAGNCVVSFVSDILSHVRAMIEFMQSLEDYNAAAAENERVILSSVLRIQPCTREGEANALLKSLVESTHMLRLGETALGAERGAGLLWLQSDEKDYALLKNNGVQLMTMPKVSWWPGQDTTCTEVVWRNPILQLKEGQQYEFGRYLIKQRMMRHTSYATYFATDLLMDRAVVMKVMLPQTSAAFLQNDRKRAHLFERIKSCGRVGHPYLAFLHDMGEHDGMVYFTREYVEGKNLSELKIPEEQRDAEVLMLLQKTVRALKYAHDRGVVFMNLKPGNIWLSDAQELKITDYRIPGFNEDATTAHVLAPSHWRYQAPEILLEGKGDSRSDIYSLGVIAYELLAGRHPYTTSRAVDSPQDIPKLRITSLGDIDKHHHRAWDKFVMRALHLDADRRFQSLEEMDNELREIQAEMLEKALKVMR